MRVSAVGGAKPDAQLYSLLVSNGRDVTVFLDGIRQANVVSADEEKGEVVRYVEDGKGGLKSIWIYPAYHLDTETLRGKVVIEIERRAR